MYNFQINRKEKKKEWDVKSSHSPEDKKRKIRDLEKSGQVRKTNKFVKNKSNNIIITAM